jgi:hypothetical protein
VSDTVWSTRGGEHLGQHRRPDLWSPQVGHGREVGQGLIHQYLRMAPNHELIVSRGVGSFKRRVGRHSLNRAVRRFTIHYHAERPHQGLENTLICGGPISSDGRVGVADRRGALLKYDYRQVAYDDVCRPSHFRAVRPPACW